MLKPFIFARALALAIVAGNLLSADPHKKHILFFTKSSGYEHSVISWQKGRPSHAESVLTELGTKYGWEFEFSKDGSKFSRDYLKKFDAVFFYTTGDLCTPGTDGQPPMTAEGKRALVDYIRHGGGLVATHSASDTFHSDPDPDKGPERYKNHGTNADPYIRLLGGEFIKHGRQQVATNRIVDPAFPGFQGLGTAFALNEEWYSLKDFNPDIHVLTVIDAPSMKGQEYERPAYPSTWARTEGRGRVWYTAMGHRDDIWTSPTFQSILVGGLHWALGEAKAKTPQNITAVAPGAYTNPIYPKSEK
jgi:type 1 glutamine amidotransferase